MVAILSERMGIDAVRRVATWATECEAHRQELLALSRSDHRRTAVNALWVMTHLDESEQAWLESLQNELIDRLLAEQDPSKKRLYLQLLRRQEISPESNRAVRLLDYCFAKINAECEPYAVRCFSLYVAYRICRPYPELVAELEQHLDLLSLQALSPGLKSALRQTRRHIARRRG